ncbi:diguanylate cyclase domain-containing protein [Psychromonas sp. KJ10-2]|uniref:diguanylate cyclase domain-containing protein n=1 Tax=Psychromonas sp. KJ10-2 TaxID=3391822 RepID=UPI0039B51FE7
MKCYNGEYRWILSRGQTVSWDTEGNPKRVIGTHTDLSLYREMLKEVKVDSELSENVTDLPDREQFLLHIEVENQRLYDQKMQGALIAFNCDRFKHISELPETNKINELLYLVARRLEQHHSNANFVAHIKGFEFVISIDDIGSDYEAASTAALQMTKDLESALQVPFKVFDEQFMLNCAFGLTLFPAIGVQASTLLHQSVRALKMAEQAQDTNIQFYDDTLSTLLQENQ